MTAKEIQSDFIKTFLKPTLKQHGYLTTAQTWYKNKDSFFLVINLQNSQWNLTDDVSFCLNIGVAVTARLKDPTKKKVTYGDMLFPVREGCLLPEERNKYSHRGGLGYQLTDKTNLDDFIAQFKTDLERHILPSLHRLQTIEDCIEFYRQHQTFLDNTVIESKLRVNV